MEGQEVTMLTSPTRAIKPNTHTHTKVNYKPKKIVQEWAYEPLYANDTPREDLPELSVECEPERIQEAGLPLPSCYHTKPDIQT